MKGTASLLRKLEKIRKAIDQEVPQTVTNLLDNEAAHLHDKYESSNASMFFTGPIDVTGSVEHSGDEWNLVASGAKLLFLEFGTGIIYPHTNPIDHPYNYAGSWSIEHSQYLTDPEKLAKYKGKWPDPYSGELIEGNPSGNVMYNEGKLLSEGVNEAGEYSVKYAIEEVLQRSVK